MDKKQVKKIDIKKTQVENLSERGRNAKTIILTDYHGLNAEVLNHLRHKIKDVGGELVITKNTLLSRALKISNLAGPTAVVFAYDEELAPLKEIATTAKVYNSPKFKFGFLGKELLDAQILENLAKIPSRDVLEAKVVGALNSPIYGIVSVLSANIRNLVSVLGQATRKASS